MKHAEAFALAEEALNALNPHCERILIAGSIRRLKPEVEDIEICAIPRMVPAGLFSDELEVDPDFCAVVRHWRKVKGEPTSPRHNILYSGAECTRPCLGNNSLTSPQSRIVYRSGPSKRQSQHL